MSDSIGSNYRPCDNAPECPNEGTKWSGIGTFGRRCLCVECDKARLRGQRVAPAVDPMIEAERRRLTEETAAAMRRAEEQSRADVLRNEELEKAARRSRHAARLSTAAPIVHPPVAPQAPRPAPKAATVAPAVPAPAVEAVEPHKPVPPRQRRPPRPLELLPHDRRVAGQCIRVGCAREVHARSLCKNDYSTAVKAGILDVLPTAPPTVHPDSNKTRVAAFVAENPGRTVDEIAAALQLLPQAVASAACVLRRDGVFAPSNGHLRGHDTRLWPAGMGPRMVPLRELLILRVHAGGMVTSSDLHTISAGAKKELKKLRDQGLIFSPAYNQNSLTRDGRKMAVDLLNNQE